jgi:hypothetical protein
MSGDGDEVDFGFEAPLAPDMDAEPVTADADDF